MAGITSAARAILPTSSGAMASTTARPHWAYGWRPVDLDGSQMSVPLTRLTLLMNLLK